MVSKIQISSAEYLFWLFCQAPIHYKAILIIPPKTMLAFDRQHTCLTINVQKNRKKCAPLLADMFYSYKIEYIPNLLNSGEKLS